MIKFLSVAKVPGDYHSSVGWGVRLRSLFRRGQNGEF